MRKLRFFFAMLMLLPLSIASSWAETVEFTPATCTSWNSTQGAQSQTIDGITLSSTSAANNTQLRLYSGATHTFTSTVGNITSIVFTCTATGTNNYGPGKLSGTGYVAGSGNTGEWTGDAASVEISGGQARCTSIVVTYTKAASTDPSISVSPNPLAFGKLLEGTYSDYYGYEVTKEIRLTGSNLTGDVSLTASGDFQIAYQYSPISAGYKFSLTVKPQAGAIDTTIVMACYSMGSGDKSGTLAVSSDASDFSTINVPLSLTLVSLPADIDGTVVDKLQISDFGVTGGYTAFTDRQASNTGHSGAVYAGTVARSGSATQYNIQMNSGQTNSKVREIASSASGGTLKRVLVLWATETANTNNRTLSVYGSNTAYTGSETEATGTKIGDLTYTTGDLFAYLDVTAEYKYVQIVAGGAIYMDRVDIAWLPKEISEPSITGQTPFYPTTTVTMDIATEDCDIVFTLDGSDPTGGDNTYSQPIVLDATTTVKARGFKGVKLGEIVSKTFTKATPITVAAAIEAIPNNNDVVNDAFVTGYVCTAGESVASGQMTYYISADGTETNRLQIYKGKNLNNTDFSATTDLAVGDKVVVFGQLKNYNGTPEMNSGNYIVERIAKGSVTSIDLTGTNTKTVFEFGDHFNPLVDGEYVVKAIYESGYKEDVTALCSWDIDGVDIATKQIQTEGTSALTATYEGKTDWLYINITKILKHKLTFSAPEHGTLEVKWLDSPITSGEEWVKTREFTVVATPDAGYQLATLTANDLDIKETKAFTMGTEDIVVTATFTKLPDGIITLNKNVLDFGAAKVGAAASSIESQVLSVSASQLTPNSNVTLSIDGTDGYFEIMIPADGKIAANASGAISEYSVQIVVADAAVASYGVKTATLRLHSDDLTADSLVTLKLTVVEPVVPSVEVTVYGGDKTLIDFGNVDKGASVSQVNISLVGHNLTGDVKVTVANATSTEVFVTNGFRPSNTYYQNDGEIDAAVIVIPKTSTAGEYTGTITFHSLTGDFEDIVIPLHINIKPDAGLSWCTENATAYTVAKPYTLPVLTNPHGVTVAYSSSDETVAKFDGSGNLDVLKDGETVITASFAGNSDYVAQEVSYTLTVRKPTAIRLDGDMTTKEYEQGDHVSIAGYTVNAIFGGDVYDIYDVTGEATWTLDGKDIAIQTVTATSSYTIEATWNGFTAWEYVNLVRKTHAVTFNNPEHGRLTVTEGGGTFISGAKFSKGRVLTITLTPDLNYAGTVTVNGEPLEGNTYTIGTEDVNIIATFTAIPPVFTIENAPGNVYRFPETKKDSEPLSFDIVFNGLYLTGDVQVLVETMSGPRNDLFVIDDNLTSKTYTPVNGQIANATVHVVAKTDVAVPWNTTGYVRFKSLSGDFTQQNVQLYVTIYEGRVIISEPDGGTIEVYKAGSDEPIVSGAEQYDYDTEFRVVATPDNDHTLGGVYAPHQIWAPYTFWSSYANVTVSAVFNLKPEAPIAWSVDEANVVLGADEPAFPTLTNDEALEVAYSSTDEDVATIAADGAITIKAVGETTIAATFTSSSSSAYRTTTVEYALTVSEQSDPTAINNTAVGEDALKFIENGQLFIRKNGKTYNAQGAIVE